MYEIILYLFLSAFFAIAALFVVIMFLTLTSDVIDECREIKEKFSKTSNNDDNIGDPGKVNINFDLLKVKQ